MAGIPRFCLLRGFDEVIIYLPFIPHPSPPNSTVAQTNGALLWMLEISLHLVHFRGFLLARAWAGLREAEGPGGPALEGRDKHACVKAPPWGVSLLVQVKFGEC